MHATFAVLALAIGALTTANPNPVPDAVSSAFAPQRSPPPGCSPNYEGDFTVYPTNITMRRSLESRQDHSKLYNTLKNGILLDQEGRTGYIASNGQFQFDDPPQAGAIFTAGFTVCKNGTLALGPSTVWFRCLSGAGSTSSHPFYNIYNHDIGSVCIESFLLTRPINGGTGPGPVGSLSTESFYTGNITSSAVPHSLPPSTTSTTMTKSGSGSGGSSSGATAGGSGPTATGSSGGSASSGSAASASASSGFAAATNLGSEMYGLAAGLLALAAF